MRDKSGLYPMVSTSIHSLALEVDVVTDIAQAR